MIFGLKMKEIEILVDQRQPLRQNLIVSCHKVTGILLVYPEQTRLRGLDSCKQTLQEINI